MAFMNFLLDVQHKLLTNSAAMGQLEQALAGQPDSVVIQANLRSLRKLHGVLTKEFHRIVSEIGVDVCRYSLLENRPTVRALSRALGSFQDAFSLVYESLRSGPMIRRYIPRDALQATDLHVAYTFPGSFGVMLTIPRQALL